MNARSIAIFSRAGSTALDALCDLVPAIDPDPSHSMARRDQRRPRRPQPFHRELCRVHDGIDT
jgi:hypothetical protein